MRKQVVAFAACVVAGSSAMAALTPVQTASFVGGENTAVGFDGSSSVQAFYKSPTLTGLQKFDPSLGTLTSVLLTIQVNASASLTLFSDELADDQAPFSLRHEDLPSATTFVQTQIGYNYDGPFTRNVAITSDSLGVTGGTDLNPADYANPDFAYEATSSIVYGGFANGGSTPRSGSIPTTADYYDADDFVGLGEVTTLSVTSNATIDLSDASFTMDNLESATITAFTRVESGNVTLQYEYTPIPEPAGLALLTLGAGLLASRRRG